MIYLEPFGGLGNRIRAIDSAITFCKRFARDLTIIWNINHELGCSFYDLYKPLQINNLNINIVEFRQYVPALKKGIVSLPKIGRIIPSIKKQNYISSQYLSEQHNQSTQNSLKETELVFYKRIENKLSNIFSDKQSNYKIRSCYRLCKCENQYDNFIPADEINSKILDKEKLLKNSIGIHIRRTDHERAILHSTTDKFLKLMNEILLKDSNKIFFLSTDSEEEKQKLINEFGDRIIYNTIGSYKRSNVDAIKDAMLDMYCLSKTEKIYGSYYSTFSLVAAEIGKIDIISVK